MRKINWERPHSWGRDIRANVDSIELTCYYCPNDVSGGKWRAIVSLDRRVGSFRSGSVRKKLVEAKEDAVLLARKLLFDFQTCLDI